VASALASRGKPFEPPDASNSLADARSFMRGPRDRAAATTIESKE